MLAGVLFAGPHLRDAVADGAGVGRLARLVAVEDVRSTAGEVRATVVNRTDEQLEDVRLLVSDEFRWRDEMHPGAESPSAAHEVTVPGPIPPHGRATVTFSRPAPLPDRADGEFTTEVIAVELTQRPVPSRPAGAEVRPAGD